MFSKLLKCGGLCLTAVGVSGRITDIDIANGLTITGIAAMCLGELTEECLTKTYTLYGNDRIALMNDLENEMDKFTNFYNSKKGK